MKITANGKPVEAADNLSVNDLLRELKVEMPEYVTVELNGEILKRQNHETTIVSDGDTLEFLYYMGGGAR